MTNRQFELLQILLDKGLLTLLAVVCGFWLKKWQDDRLATVQRQFVPRTEFELSCKFLGPEAGEYLVDVSIRVNNKGTTRRKFKQIKLRLRGIKAEAPLEYWDPVQKGRLLFPERLIKDEFILGGADSGNYYYVEPQVSQIFTYVTKIPGNIRYVLAHVKLVPMTEDQEEPYENEFTEERLFLVPANNQVPPDNK